MNPHFPGAVRSFYGPVVRRTVFSSALLILFTLLALVGLVVLVRYISSVTNPDEEREELERFKGQDDDSEPNKSDGAVLDKK